MKIALTIVLVFAFIGGTILAYTIFTNKKPPLSDVNIHGVVALLVLLLLGYSAFDMSVIRLWIALGVLVMASFGGLYLVSNHKKGQPGPKSAIIIHAVFAISGIALTLISIW